MRWWISLFLCCWALTAQATVDPYQFDTPAKLARYEHLTDILRCPKCQDENIRNSGAPIAADMRAKVAAMIRDGATDQQVIDALVSRFGEFVLYKPRLERRTWLLWYGPFVVGVIGLLVVWVLAMRGRRLAHERDREGRLSAEERERLRQLLDEDSRTS
ncbi:cytochrome c-type biogenesis protein [Mangrovitalea sediminis]|uniref:cytochrome c-type biogenesis protein n=1 Tax=Mangrovitalea sediminis TaxID=1982043 RepID=UPI000BE57FF4|nr:cytochrome c-type biogenesis protein [Mangrovitalea sediminis]